MPTGKSGCQRLCPGYAHAPLFGLRLLFAILRGAAGPKKTITLPRCTANGAFGGVNAGGRSSATTALVRATVTRRGAWDRVRRNGGFVKDDSFRSATLAGHVKVDGEHCAPLSAVRRDAAPESKAEEETPDWTSRCNAGVNRCALAVEDAFLTPVGLMGRLFGARPSWVMNGHFMGGCWSAVGG